MSLELWHRYMPSYVLYGNIDGINGSAGLRRLRMCDDLLQRVTPSKVEIILYAGLGVTIGADGGATIVQRRQCISEK